MKNKPIILFCVFFLMLPIAMSITLTEESLVSGQLEFIGKMISKLSPSEFVNTVKYIELWEGNVFRNAKPELNLVRVFDSAHTNIVLGDLTKTIKNSAVLREGVTESWGYKHIFETRADGVTNHGRDIMDRFGLNNHDEVMDLIGKSLKYGKNKGIFTNPNTGEKAFQIVYTQNSKELLVIISAEQKNFGSIITAYPN